MKTKTLVDFQTLSKALEMSKKIPLTSKGGLHSNDL